MLLLIDNYDSFTFNLAQLFSCCGADVKVVLHDQYDLKALKRFQPDSLVVSPGPGRPESAGISCAALEYFAGRIPVLGVCLGHQCLAQIYGGKIVAAQSLMHGETSMIDHHQQALFSGLSRPFEAMRYHSLAVEQATLPEEFEVSAWTEDNEIMGLRHTPTGAEGVQFHPESILSACGEQIVQNFLS